MIRKQHGQRVTDRGINLGGEQHYDAVRLCLDNNKAHTWGRHLRADTWGRHLGQTPGTGPGHDTPGDDFVLRECTHVHVLVPTTITVAAQRSPLLGHATQCLQLDARAYICHHSD